MNNFITKTHLDNTYNTTAISTQTFSHGSTSFSIVSGGELTIGLVFEEQYYSNNPISIDFGIQTTTDNTAYVFLQGVRVDYLGGFTSRDVWQLHKLNDQNTLFKNGVVVYTYSDILVSGVDVKLKLCLKSPGAVVQLLNIQTMVVSSIESFIPPLQTVSTGFYGCVYNLYATTPSLQMDMLLVSPVLLNIVATIPLFSNITRSIYRLDATVPVLHTVPIYSLYTIKATIPSLYTIDKTIIHIIGSISMFSSVCSGFTYNTRATIVARTPVFIAEKIVVTGDLTAVMPSILHTPLNINTLLIATTIPPLIRADIIYPLLILQANIPSLSGTPAGSYSNIFVNALVTMPIVTANLTATIDFYTLVLDATIVRLQSVVIVAPNIYINTALPLLQADIETTIVSPLDINAALPMSIVNIQGLYSKPIVNIDSSISIYQPSIKLYMATSCALNVAIPVIETQVVGVIAVPIQIQSTLPSLTAYIVSASSVQLTIQSAIPTIQNTFNILISSYGYVEATAPVFNALFNTITSDHILTIAALIPPLSINASVNTVSGNTLVAVLPIFEAAFVLDPITYIQLNGITPVLNSFVTVRTIDGLTIASIIPTLSAQISVGVAQQSTLYATVPVIAISTVSTNNVDLYILNLNNTLPVFAATIQLSINALYINSAFNMLQSSLHGYNAIPVVITAAIPMLQNSITLINSNYLSIVASVPSIQPSKKSIYTVLSSVITSSTPKLIPSIVCYNAQSINIVSTVPVIRPLILQNDNYVCTIQAVLPIPAINSDTTQQHYLNISATLPPLQTNGYVFTGYTSIINSSIPSLSTVALGGIAINMVINANCSKLMRATPTYDIIVIGLLSGIVPRLQSFISGSTGVTVYNNSAVLITATAPLFTTAMQGSFVYGTIIATMPSSYIYKSQLQAVLPRLH